MDIAPLLAGGSLALAPCLCDYVLPSVRALSPAGNHAIGLTPRSPNMRALSRAVPALSAAVAPMQQGLRERRRMGSAAQGGVYTVVPSVLGLGPRQN